MKTIKHLTRNVTTLAIYRAPVILAGVILSILLTLASSSPAASPLQSPQTFAGTLTNAEFISCSGQLLDPPAYSIAGTWVLQIDSMTQPQVAPPAQLTMIVFRDGSRYLMFPHIELTPISVTNGVYTYSFGSSVIMTLDTNTNPALFYWDVQFTDNCTIRNYRSLTYFGEANP